MQSHREEAPPVLQAKAEPVTLYELAEGKCGEATIHKTFKKQDEEYASLKEGNCSSNGYTLPDGIRELDNPVLGET